MVNSAIQLNLHTGSGPEEFNVNILTKAIT